MVGFFGGLCLVGASAISLSAEFELFKREFGRVYPSPEAEAAALAAFGANARLIRETNSDASKHYSFGYTRFSDLTPGQFRAQVAGYRRSSGDAAQQARRQPRLDAVHATPPPASIDWVAKGAVTVRQTSHAQSLYNLQNQSRLSLSRNAIAISPRRR
jgi:cathepsin F